MWHKINPVMEIKRTATFEIFFMTEQGQYIHKEAITIISDTLSKGTWILTSDGNYIQITAEWLKDLSEIRRNGVQRALEALENF